MFGNIVITFIWLRFAWRVIGGAMNLLLAIVTVRSLRNFRQFFLSCVFILCANFIILIFFDTLHYDLIFQLTYQKYTYKNSKWEKIEFTYNHERQWHLKLTVLSLKTKQQTLSSIIRPLQTLGKHLFSTCPDEDANIFCR